MRGSWETSTPCGFPVFLPQVKILPSLVKQIEWYLADAIWTTNSFFWACFIVLWNSWSFVGLRAALISVVPSPSSPKELVPHENSSAFSVNAKVKVFPMQIWVTFAGKVSKNGTEWTSWIFPFLKSSSFHMKSMFSSSVVNVNPPWTTSYFSS